MGLFSGKKDKDDKAPPMSAPPVPGSAPPAPSMPPAPEGASTSEEPPKVEPTGTLTPPPVPGGNLDDIKSAVSGEEFAPSVENESSSSNFPSTDVASSDSMMSDDSLFDFSDLDIPEASDEVNQIKSDVDETKQQMFQSSSSTQMQIPQDIPSETVDTNLDHEEHLNFISNRDVPDRVANPNDTYFVTTSQFKALLEIVEGVKNKVKESSERHLRLLDIKSEEDIEYENLRKDFQYIEDKLYEVDSIIFEK